MIKFIKILPNLMRLSLIKIWFLAGNVEGLLILTELQNIKKYVRNHMGQKLLK